MSSREKGILPLVNSAEPIVVGSGRGLSTLQEEPITSKATKFEFNNKANYPADDAPSKVPQNLKMLGEIHPLNVLLVEDNKIYQKIVGKFLFELGYSFDVCSNGVEVMELYRQRNYQQVYDVILMDLEMPVMDGRQTTNNIQRMFSPIEQPTIVALTGSDSITDTMFCLQHGFVYYIAKPISGIELARVLHRCQPLARSSARVTKFAQSPQPLMGNVRNNGT
eukprot:CFRG0174T1